MSDTFAKLASLKTRVPRRLLSGPFNNIGRAGPRRPVFIICGGVGLMVLAVAVTSGGRYTPSPSRDAQLKKMDPLPGGLNTTPEQDAVSLKATDAAAGDALSKGVSYTPPMAPSQHFVDPDVANKPRRKPVVHTSKPAPLPVLHAAVPVTLASYSAPVAKPPIKLPPQEPAEKLTATTVAATPAETQAQQQANAKMINDMLSQWGSRAPRTDVIMPLSTNEDPADPAPQSPVQRGGSPAATTPVAEPVALSVRPPEASGRVLVPAGRGIYAHAVLALSSDTSSPAIFQADSGPIAGDRMLGSFAREDERLVIHINSIVHNNLPISVDGLAVAPQTMEAGVASNVDHHYAERFILPAAAAFVSGLGQAIATTSNSTAVLSPFGGATTTTNLKLPQQLGVAAGSAASQLSSTLAASAPKGPTVELEANVAVGIMFLSNVTLPHS